MSTSYSPGREGTGDQDPYERFYQFPASFGQERLWFLSQLEPGADTAYHLCAATRLTGPLDRVVLQRALDRVIDSQESLRTGVAFMGDGLRQIVRPAATLAVPLVDRSHLPPQQQRAEVRRLAVQESRRPFTLDDPPLMRLMLIKLGDQEHVLVMVLHHLVADGWSLEILLTETARTYVHLTTGAEDPLPERPVQYADYAVWQREQLSDDFVAAELAHWRTRLRGLPPLQLPTDRPRPPVRSGRGALCRTRVDAAVVDALVRIGEKRGATLYMVLLAAYEVLLSRYGRQHDFAVGTAVANRHSAEVEGLIGLFANTLVLRADLDGDPRFTDVLDRVQAVCLDAYSHQDLPFERLVEELRPVRDLSRSPLFQVMFLFQESPGATAIGDLTMHPPLELDPGTAKFDLTLSATRTASGLDLALEYSTELFDPATAELLLDYLGQILVEVGRHPQTLVGDLALVAPAGATNAVEHGGEPAPGSDQPVLEQIRAVAARHADAVALVDAGTTLTYRAMTERVDRLAARLAAAGVRPGQLVAVCVPRSVDLPVALLAVWRAGAAYLPVDLNYPAARVAHILGDAAVTVALTTAEHADDARLAGHRLVLVDGPDDARIPPPAAPVADRRDAAYVIYTSGSTGRPKGVQIDHGNLAAHLSAVRDALGMDAAPALAAVTSVSFDIAGLEMFLPLTCGGRVAVMTAEDATDGHRLAALLADRRIDVMQATPAGWRLLLAAGWRPGPGFRVLCGGEALDPELAGRLTATGATVWNLYGPTEATIWASAGRVTDPDRVDLGSPLAGNRRYLLDDALRPVPTGSVGELYLGGECVGVGYVRDPALTAQRFLPDPFAGRPSARMYRTGDLCRYTSRGELQFIGRADRQIKIRGFRLECTEIEAVLAHHPDVEQVAVVDQRLDDDDVRLVAHVVPAARGGGEAVDGGELTARLRAEAARHLPAYAVPSVVNIVDRMPLTPAGKVDHAALRELTVSALVAADDAEPGTPVERTIAAAFADILGVARVGLSASFFELGGHSLLAARLVARIRDEIGVAVPVRVLFETPTVSGLAAAAEKALGDRGGTDAGDRADAVLAQLSDEQVEDLLRQLTGPPGSTGPA